MGGRGCGHISQLANPSSSTHLQALGAAHARDAEGDRPKRERNYLFEKKRADSVSSKGFLRSSASQLLDTLKESINIAMGRGTLLVQPVLGGVRTEPVASPAPEYVQEPEGYPARAPPAYADPYADVDTPERIPLVSTSAGPELSTRSRVILLPPPFPRVSSSSTVP